MAEKACLPVSLVVILGEIALKPFDVLMCEPIKFLRFVCTHNIKIHTGYTAQGVGAIHDSCLRCARQTLG